jgi:hypothetical protein
VMAVEPIEDQRQFLSALGAFEREARDRHAGWLSQFPAARDSPRGLDPARPACRRGRGQPVAQPRGRLSATCAIFDRLRDLVARASRDRARHEGLGFTGRIAGDLPGYASGRRPR